MCASSKYSYLSSLEFLPLSDRKIILTRVCESYDVLYNESICSIFRHVGFNSSNLSSLTTPSSATAFPHVSDSDIKGIDGEDIAEVTEY